MARMSGAWKSTRVFLSDPAAPLHTADTAHGTPGDTPDPNPTWIADQGPADPPPAYLADYVGNEWFPYEATGGWVDHTPYTDSSVGYAGSGAPDEEDWQTRAQAGAAHAQSMGADVMSQAGNAATITPVQQAGERYEVIRFDSPRAVQLNPAVASRGFNGQALNSDEALIRPGIVEQTFVERRMLAPAERVHEHRLVQPNTATVPTNTPPSQSPYGSPFMNLARAMTRTWQSPMVRRDPPPMDEQLVSDGTDTQYATYAGTVGDEWVIG